MEDAITAAIGTVIMVAFILAIAAKLNEVSLWLVAAVGIGLMLWAFWKDDWESLLKRKSK